MRTNLIETLLRFATASKPALEDPITEVLAWLLDGDAGLRDAFCGLLSDAASQRGLAFRLRRPAIRTQVVVPRIGGGSSRYDLVLDGSDLSAIVELKVHAPLTPSAVVDPAVDEMSRHQIDDYLRIVSLDGAKHRVVFTLAPGRLDVGDNARAHPRYGGHVMWQAVYDAFTRRLRSRGASETLPPHRMIAEQLLGSMELRGMATHKMTLEGALAVRRFSRFQRSFRAALERAWHELYADGTLDGFFKYDKRSWQDGDQWDRMGYRLWAHRDDSDHYGFIGIWYGDDDTLVEGVPDLCFFLQAKPESAAGLALDRRAAEISSLVSALDARRSPHVRWHHEPGTWAVVWATTSLTGVVLDADPSAAVAAQLRDAIKAARDAGSCKSIWTQRRSSRLRRSRRRRRDVLTATRVRQRLAL